MVAFSILFELNAILGCYELDTLEVCVCSSRFVNILCQSAQMNREKKKIGLVALFFLSFGFCFEKKNVVIIAIHCHFQ